MFGQAHDARFELVAAIQLARHGVILRARDIPQQVAIPLDAYRARVVRVGRLAHQRERITDLQLIPHTLAFVKLETGNWRTLDQDARHRLRRFECGADERCNDEEKPSGPVHGHQNGCNSTSRMIATSTTTGSSFSQRKNPWP